MESAEVVVPNMKDLKNDEKPDILVDDGDVPMNGESDETKVRSKYNQYY